MNTTTSDLTHSSIRRLEESGLFHALAGAGDGACAVAADRTILLWNRAAERLLGHAASEVVGKTCCEIFAAPGGSGRSVCPHAQSAEASSSGTVDVRARRKAGEPIWLNVSTLTLPPENGEGPVTIHLFRRTSPILHEMAPAAPAEGAAPSTGTAPTTGAVGPLTPRESEVLRLLASGANTKAAAQKLGVSPSTVRNHVQNMFMKLGVHSRLEAVAYARTHEMI